MSFVKFISRACLIPQDLNNPAIPLTERKTRIYCLSAFIGAAAGSALFAATRKALPRNYAVLASAAVGIGSSLLFYEHTKMQVKEVLDDHAVSLVYNGRAIPANAMDHLRNNPGAFLKLCEKIKDVCDVHKKDLWELFFTHDNFPTEDGSLFAKLVDQLDPIQCCLDALQKRNSKVFQYLIAKPDRFAQFLKHVIDKRKNFVEHYWIWNEMCQVSAKINWDEHKELIWDFALLIDKTHPVLVDKICSNASLNYCSFRKALMAGCDQMVKALSDRGLRVEHFLADGIVPADVVIDAEALDMICSKPLDTKLISGKKLWDLICKLDHLPHMVYADYARSTPKSERFEHFLYAVRSGLINVVTSLITVASFTPEQHRACWASLRDAKMASLIRQKYAEQSTVPLRRELNSLSEKLLKEVAAQSDTKYKGNFTQIEHLKAILAAGMTDGLENAKNAHWFLRKCLKAQSILNSWEQFPKELPDQELFEAMCVMSHTIDRGALWLLAPQLWSLILLYDQCEGALYSKLVLRSLKDTSVREGFSEIDIQNKFEMAVCAQRSPKVVCELLSSEIIIAADLNDSQQFKCLISSGCPATTHLLKKYGFNVNAVDPTSKMSALEYVRMKPKYDFHYVDLEHDEETSKLIRERRDNGITFNRLVASSDKVSSVDKMRFDRICTLSKKVYAHDITTMQPILWPLVCKFDHCCEQSPLFMELVGSIDEESFLQAVSAGSSAIVEYLLKEKWVNIAALQEKALAICTEKSNPDLAALIQKYIQPKTGE